MALVIADRVRETSTTTGTGTLTLDGAVSGFQTFSTAIGNTNTCYYTITLGADWEVGLGTVAAGTLARTTILKSSNAGSAVNFGAGIKDVFATYPADRAVLTDLSQTLTSKTIEAGTFTNGYTEEVVTANTSTAYTIDLANGSVQILTLTGNCTFTFPTATAGKGFTLLLLQDATGSRTATWPAAVKWPASTAPTITATASKMDKYVFVADGTNWIGSNAGQNYL
jgi:hypothetical protein